MEVVINGEKRELPAGVTVARLLQQLSVRPEMVAVEVNLTVLKRAQHPGTVLKEGDQVEIVHLIGGGATQTQGAGRRSMDSGLKAQDTGQKAPPFSPESCVLYPESFFRSPVSRP